jgi:NADPH-dependent curcumin reductase CurA
MTKVSAQLYRCWLAAACLCTPQVALLREVGFDAAFNYHTTPKEQALKDAAPDGIDIYWCGTFTSVQSGASLI